MRNFSIMPCPDITWGKAWSQESFMEIRSLLAIILSIQSSITKDITTTAGIYTQQQPEQEGDNRQQAGAFPPAGTQRMMLGGPSPFQGCQAGPSPPDREFQELLRSVDAFTMSLKRFCEHSVPSNLADSVIHLGQEVTG